MNNHCKHILFSLLIVISSLSFGQGTTTSGINGRVVDEKNKSLPGATVLAIHEPTGSQFATVSNSKGIFHIPNMDIGGPYKVIISFIGYEDVIKENIFLTLGQTFEINEALSTENLDIEEVIITANLINPHDIFDGNRTGSETIISSEQIGILPTVDRRIADFARLTPQASTSNGVLSIAGQNNRYNSIMIDGAVNNDAFGLSSTGTNGGQTGLSPISMDAIEQFQVVLAPYDVRQSGFTGGGINAVTRRGTNKFTGSAYVFRRCEKLAGKTPTDDENIERTSLDPFSSLTTGFRLGGPIIKNKLFFFASYENLKQETPQPFTFVDSLYGGSATYEQLTQTIPNKLTSMNYSTGGFEANTQKKESNKLLLRIDWNISNKHRLMLRHSFTKNEATLPNPSSNSSINYLNNGIYFPSTTNVTALEFKSNLNNASNSFMFTYTHVLDDRNPMGQDFPSIRINDDRASINFGSEPYSTANQLEQKITTFSDNFTLYKGAHTITIGTHNEIGKVNNLFLSRAFGEYTYNSVSDFINDNLSYKYKRSYSLVDDISGDGSKAAAEFSVIQLGLYFQDDWQIYDNLKLNFGLRFDMPIFPDNPMEIAGFDTTLAKINSLGVETYGAASGNMPNNQILLSPRLGFNWDIFSDKSLQVRGGTGIFTSRLPLVWPGGAYTNNGLLVGKYTAYNTYSLSNNYDPYNQPPLLKPTSTAGGQVDLFASDYKFPQVWRSSIAVDKKLPWELVATLEGIFTKTINNGLYYNINLKPSETNMTGNGNDNRSLYAREDSKIEEAYDHIIVGTNTSKGYSYNLTAQLQKPFSKGFSGSIAYNFGRSMVLSDNSSSQNSSQWQKLQTVNGRNTPELSISNFDAGHRIVANIAYQIEYSDFGKTTISLYYNIQSGMPYSYTYTEGVIGDDIDDTESDLIYVPANRNEINLVDLRDENGILIATADQQWTDLENYINNDEYLKSRKGNYAERNASRAPFSNILDLKIVQDFYLKTNNYTHTLQLTFDIFNLTNLINKDWGRTYWVNDKNDKNNFGLITPVGFEANNTTMQYTFQSPASHPWEINDSGLNSSRWYGQIGIRYIF